MYPEIANIASRWRSPCELRLHKEEDLQSNVVLLGADYSGNKMSHFNHHWWYNWFVGKRRRAIVHHQSYNMESQYKNTERTIRQGQGVARLCANILTYTAHLGIPVILMYR